MSNNHPFRTLFKSASVTYYYSSIFFPKDVRDDVFSLYAYVRTADDFVDTIPQNKKGFMMFSRQTLKVVDNPALVNSIEDPVIRSFVDLATRKRFEPEWTRAFLNAMRADLIKHKYKTYEELEKYMYGSAEVIGLMMAAIMDLPKKSYPFAQAQGQAMQLINFVRDVKEDTSLGRTYLSDISYDDATERQKKKMLAYVSKYKSIQHKAEKGYRFIPKRYLIPIKTAADMYMWTARNIENDPMIPFTKKIKPKPMRVLAQLMYNAITL